MHNKSGNEILINFSGNDDNHYTIEGDFDLTCDV